MLRETFPFDRKCLKKSSFETGRAVAVSEKNMFLIQDAELTSSTKTEHEKFNFWKEFSLQAERTLSHLTPGVWRFLRVSH